MPRFEKFCVMALGMAAGADLVGCGDGGSLALQSMHSAAVRQTLSTPDLPLSVIFERGILTQGEVTIDAWETRSAELEYYVRYAAGLESAPGQDWVAHVESEESDLGSETNLHGEINHIVRVILTGTHWLTRDERLAEVERACDSGEMSSERCADRRSRLETPLSPQPRAILSTYAEDYLSTLAESQPTLAEACGPPIPRAYLPETSLVFELLEDLDRDTARDSLRQVIETRAASGRSAQSQLAADLLLGAWIGIPDTACVQVLATKTDILRFAEHPSTRVIYVGSEVDSDTGDGESTLPTVRSAIQAVQFHDANDTGGAAPSSGNGFTRLTLAVNDADMNDEHVALLDNTSISRVVGEFTCLSGSACTPANLTSTGTGVSHGMKTLGVAVGDLLDGQDPIYTSTIDRDRRTGVAPEAGIILLQPYGGNASRRAATTARTLRADVLNLSDGFEQGTCPDRPTNGSTDGDYCTSASAPICSGFSSSMKDAINLAFEDGVFFVKSAGNKGSADSSCTCTVTNPGDAEGAFPVASLQPPSSSSTGAAPILITLQA